MDLHRFKKKRFFFRNSSLPGGTALKVKLSPKKTLSEILERAKGKFFLKVFFVDKG